MNQQTVTSTVHFPKAGPNNTEECLRAAAARAGHLGIVPVIVASCSGDTAYRALEHFDPDRFRLIAVTHVTGFRSPDEQEMQEQVREDLQQKGFQVLTAAHAFGGVGRGIRTKLNTYQVEEIMAYTLRMFGQGVKVGVEMALMCADAGLVRTTEDVMAIGGTMSGADTAMVVAPANSHSCLDLKVREIVAKPHRP
jgi:hypothetical protein